MLAIDCEKRKIKVLIKVYIKMSRNLNSSFSNLGSKLFGCLAIFQQLSDIPVGSFPAFYEYNRESSSRLRRKGYLFQASGI